jgi:8-oxo-dGTP pyrophosphatase MutT (NUDIX family)
MSSQGEWWDVVDADGAPIDATFRRGSGPWPPGCFHLVVAVCAQRADGAVLLTRRAASKDFAFGWEFPSGSALAGESSYDAASRELREETGLDVEPLKLIPIGRFVEDAALLDFYVARVTGNETLALQSTEVMAAEWVTPDEVIRRLDADRMAEPWSARLYSLWPSTEQELRRAR